ncbi:MAG: retention module-containing protein [Chromatiaceae bacterium]|nr:retention module-containing protein [Chromatiaceae bacterium]
MAEQNATTQSPNVIGEVKSITGKVVAIGAGGERTLAAGDPVFADDLIKTIGVSTVVITLNDGTRFDLGRDAEGLLDESVYGGDIEVLRAAAVVEAAEIQRAIAEGADPTAVTEPPAAGETTTGSESLGEGVTVERTGRVGAVEAGYETTAPGQAVDSLFGEPIDFGLTAEQPTASIVLDPVTADNIVNAAESGGLVAITGTVGGDVADGDIVTLIINGVEYSGPVSGGQFSIAVPGGELVADPDQTIEASVTTSTGSPAGEATAVDDQAYSSDTFVPDASISLDPVTADNVISAAESGTVVTLTGSVGGDVVDGDTVTVIVNGGAYTGVVSDGRFSVDVPGSELAADPDQTVEASVTTSTGSINGEATAVDDQAFGVDTDVPEASIALDPVTADNLVNFAESGGPVAITGSVGGDVADGDTVIVTVNGVEYSGPVNGGVFSITVPGGQLVADADHTIQARVTTTTGSVNGEATASDSQSYGVDTTPPVAQATASIVIDPVTADNLLTDAEAGGDVSITGRVGGDVADGDIVFLNVNGSVYQGPVSGGTFNISVSGAQLLADADHTIQARVTTTTGNPGGEATATDSQTYFVESGGGEPTIDIDPVTGDNQVDDSEDDSVTLSGSTTGVEPGQTVSVVIEDGTGATVFSGGATVQADGSWSIPGVDLSGLPDGAPYTVLADVSDAAGNPAPQASEPFQTVDTTGPTIDIDPVTGDNQVDDSEDDSVTLSGSTTGVEPGQTVSVVIEDGTGATVFSGSATVQADGSWSIPGVDLSGLPDGAPYTVLADVSDAAGNPAPQASEPFQTVDTTGPTIDIDPVTGDNQVDDSEDDSVTLSGSTTGVEPGQTVSVVIEDGTGATVFSGSATVQADGSWSIPGVDLSGLPDGAPYTVLADVSDAAGNPAPQASEPFQTLDTTGPTIDIDPVTGDNQVDDSEDDSVTLSGSTTGVEPGQTVSVVIEDGTGATVFSGSATVQADGSWSIPGVDLSGLPDGAPYTVLADVSDAAGNPAPQATENFQTLDTTGPTIDIDPVTGDNQVDDSEDDSVTLSGSTTGVEPGQTVSVVIEDGTGATVFSGSATVQADGSWSIPGVDLSGLPDGAPYTVLADVSDAAGNPAPQATENFQTLDTTGPTIDIDPVTGDNQVDDSEDDSVTLSGSTTGVEPGQTVSVVIEDGTGATVFSGSATVQADGSWSIPGVDLSGLPDGAPYTVLADVSDAAGNPAPQATENFQTLDTTGPTIDIDPVTGDNQVDDSEDDSVTLSGSTTGVEPGQTVSVVIEDGTGATVFSGSATVQADGSWSIPGVDLSGLPDGAPYTVLADVSDAAGNPAPQATENFQTLDTTGPTIDIDPVTGDNQVDDSEDDSVTLSGSTTGVEPGQTVSVVIEDGTGATVFSGSATVQADGSWSIPGVDLSGLPDGAPYTVLADVSDAAGNPAPQASEPFQTVDTTAPPAPTVTIVEDADNDGVITAAELSGDIDVQVGLPLGAVAGDVIRVSDGVTVTEITLTPGDIVAGSVSASFANPGNGNTIDVTATLTDAAGNTSAPGSDSAILNLVTASITIDPNITPDDLISPDEQIGDVLVTGTVGGDVADGDIVTLTVNGGTYQGPVSGGTFSIAVPGAELAADADNVIEAGVTVTDVLGNDITATDIEGYSVAQVIDPAEYGMRGEYYGYNDREPLSSYLRHPDDQSVGNLNSLSDIVTIIDGRSGPVVGTIDEGRADATFRTSYVDYGLVNNHLGTGRTLQSFLAHDAASLSRDPRDSTDAIVRIIGFMMIDATSLDFRVRSDDGFQVRIGDTVFGNPTNHSPTTDTFNDVAVEPGLQEVEILYWDQAFEAVLEIEVKAADEPDSAFEFLGQGRFGLFQPTFDVALDANQTIIEDPSTPGQFLVVEGSELVGGAGTDVLEGGDYLDILVGGPGDDLLSGGAEADLFKWNSGDEGTPGDPASDTITDFSIAERDALDLSSLLSGEDSGNLTDYLHFESSPGGTLVHVSSAGGFAGGYDAAAEDQTILLQSVDLTALGGSDQEIVDALLAGNNLIIG